MTASDAPIQGVFAAIPTPFDERRGVDVKALEYLADYLFERGIAGLALFTEASEDALLAPEERRLIIKTVAASSRQAQRVYVDSGDSGPSMDDLADTKDLASAYRSICYVEGVDLHYVVQPGAVHNEVYWAQRLPGALRFLFGNQDP